MSNSPMNVEAVKAKECVAYLRKAADEIARAGHNGWGNTCTLAADEIERLTERLATLERAAGKIVETEAEYWAKRFATMDRAAAPPAPAVPEGVTDLLYDNQWIAGAQFGWNCGLQEEREKLNAAINARLAQRHSAAPSPKGKASE